MAFYKIKNKKEKAFYIFDEHCFYEDEWLKIGGKIHKDSQGIKKYLMNNFEYKCLNRHEIYSGFETTFMKMPEMSYNELLYTMYNTNTDEERLGAIGLLLKKHKDMFIEDLFNIDFEISARKKKRCCKDILFISKECTEVAEMTQLLLKLNNKKRNKDK